MKLIVGLGNPGRVYAGTRHNIGFSVVNAFAKDCRIALRREERFSSLIGKGRLKNHNMLLVLPVTFMNLSGSAVCSIAAKYKMDLENLLVVYDDLDLALGRIKIRNSGSSAGHKGVESIIDSLKSNQFCRLRIGIGRPKNNEEVTDYVLSPFPDDELGKVKEVIQEAKVCCRFWVLEGMNTAMNMFNRISGGLMG